MTKQGAKKTETMMKTIERDFAGEGTDAIYQSNIGKGIDGFSLIKRGNTLYMIVNGVGYCVPMGGATVINPMLGVTAAGLAGTGRAAEETLHEMKLGSREGVRGEYEAGRMTKEEYDRYEKVWNLSDKEYEEYLFLVQTGVLTNEKSPEELEALKTIRDMPETWTTKENFDKARVVGLGTGLWEATQWYLGGKLNPLKTIKGSRLGASALRILTDTGFNALDTPYKSLLNSAALNKDFVKSFEERGGWTDVLVNTGVGLIGSLIGEGIDSYQFRQQKVQMPDNLDIEIKHRMDIDEEIVDDLSEELRETYMLMKEKLCTMEELGVSPKELKTIFGEKIKIWEDVEGFEEMVRAANGDPGIVVAGYVDGMCHFKSGFYTTSTGIHEVNHALGEIKLRGDNIPQSGTRGINEAFTELLALEIAGIDGSGTSGYATNVAILQAICADLEKKGYSHKILYDSYYNGSFEPYVFQDAMRAVTGSDKAFLELVENMNYSDQDGLGQLMKNMNDSDLDNVMQFGFDKYLEANERNIEILHYLDEICSGGGN